MTDNEDDRPLHEVTREELQEALARIFGLRPPRDTSGWETAVELYAFIAAINPDDAERWAKAYRRLCGYRD